MPRQEAVTDYLLDAANVIADSGWWDRQRLIADREERRLTQRREIEAAIQEEETSPEVTQRRLSVTAEALGVALLKEGVDATELSTFLDEFAETTDRVKPATVPQETGVAAVASVVRHTLQQKEYTDSLLRKAASLKPQQTEPEAVPQPPISDRNPLKEETFWKPSQGMLDLSQLEIPSAPDPLVIKVNPPDVLPQQSLVDPEETAYILIDQGDFYAGKPGERQGERMKRAFDPEETMVMRPVGDRDTVILPVLKPWQVVEPPGAWPQQ